MSRSVILLITIASFLTFGGSTKNDTETADRINYSSSINISDPCLGKRCINKCCPLGYFVQKGKICAKFDAVLNLSSLTVYNEDVEETGKNAQDLFTLSPGRFDDPLFKDEAFVWSNFNYRPYIIESGDLILELPNVYNRWNRINNANFCVDYPVTKNGVLKRTPKIWSVIESEEMDEPSIYLTSAMIVSCVCLLLVLVVYILLPELRNLHGWILMAYVASLFMAFLLLATIQLATYSIFVCLGLTLGIYYFFLASFCWMSVMSYDIWWTFRGYAKARQIHRRGKRFKFQMYCLYAWGVPFVMAIALGVFNEIDMTHLPWFITPHIPQMGCFIEGGTKFVYLYIPMLILIICNVIFYLMTAFNVWRLNRGTAVLDSAAAGTPAAHRTQWHRFMVYLKLSVVMGLSWLFEIVSFLYPQFKVWCISDAYNILVGFAIFLIFVCKKKIFKKLYKRYAFNVSRTRPYHRSKSYSTNSDSGSETVTLQVSHNPKGLNGYSGSMKSMSENRLY